MNKWRNSGLWLALAALLGMILQDTGVPITPERYEMYMDVVLGVLAGAGIISNPAVGKWFVDRDVSK
ncbi:MAG TPA: holin [Bacillus sp. (in: firmicutes)]|nr:holin [Bacillus sp. (in: firmicutes)]